MSEIIIDTDNRSDDSRIPKEVTHRLLKQFDESKNKLALRNNQQSVGAGQPFGDTNMVLNRLKEMFNQASFGSNHNGANQPNLPMIL